MKTEITFYLAGKIQKAHEQANETYWTTQDQETLRQFLAPTKLTFLNPASRTDDLSDQLSVFGRDMIQVFSADFVLVDARDRRGLGVGAEMMWAKFNHIPVISLAPKGGHYHKESTSLLGVNVEGWIHPFVEQLSDVLVETLEEAAGAIRAYASDPNRTVKGPSHVHQAMSYYLETQYPKDLPMQALAEDSQVLMERLESVLSGAV